MIETAPGAAADPAVVEGLLRDELGQGDAMLGSAAPILRHLLANDDNSIFSEEVIARLRGMFADLARQLLDLLAAAEGESASREHAPADIAALSDLLLEQPALLGHAHAVALEGQLAERLHARLALDPVLSPLLQALVASAQAGIAADAMALLASQARFVQAQRRMQLPLIELPGDLLHTVLLAMRHHAGAGAADQERAAAAEMQMRSRYDESRTRLGQVARIVTAMGAGASVALSVSHAGVAIFVSALALASGQDRDLAVLSTGEGQLARLALSLRAAGLKPQAIEEQFLSLHPDALMPESFDVLSVDRAAAILAHSTAWPGG